jgi:RNA polymerase sigma-70 factor (ECF subfamily)
MPGIEKSEFIELFNRQYQPVRNFVFYQTGDSAVADDIAQDTFSKIWEKRDSVRLETAKQLAFTIASNLCKNRFEHRKIVLAFENRKHFAGSAESPEFEMELNQFSDRLKSAINGLNEKNRMVFLMNRIDGMTYNEIASNLGISVKAIEKRMKNALDDLKTKIEFKI